MNRIIHRVGAFLVVLLTLWLGTTGSWMQLLDFKAILTQAPPSDPTQLSIVEGMYGPANFAVIQVADFTAAPLPAGFDISHGIDTVLQSARAAQEQRGGQGGPTAWTELRVVDGVPVGQVMKGSELEAFNAQTGESVKAVVPEQIPQGGRLPPSLRQKLKTLHRFWNRGDTPGVYFEFLAGLVLFTLVITGLIMYFRLLSARAKIGRRQWFWFTGGLWRGLHRAVSVVAAAFLLCIAFSGTWIGYESSWGHIGRPFAGLQPGLPAQAGPPGAGGGRRAPIIPLSDSEVQAMTVTTMAAMQRLHAGTPIKAIRLRTFGQMKQGVVITDGAEVEQLVFDAVSGQPASLTEPSYPRSNFPFGVQMHENMKHFHSGAMFGISTRLMNLFAGLSLVFLSVSGLVVYFDMWLKRRRGGRSALIWR